VIAEPTLIRRYFPYLAGDTVGVLHARRCGWFSGQQLGMYLLERAREKGARLVEGRVEGIETRGGRVSAVRVATAGGTRALATPRVVIAAGPFVKRVTAMLGVDLPVYTERHAKIAFADEARAMPRDAPLTIWADPHRIPWSAAERQELGESPAHRRLLDALPAGAHGRPEGPGESRWVLGIWTYDVEPVEPVFPIEADPWYAEIVLRGLARMIPGMAPYLGRMPRCIVDGGYYTKTRENRFLAGPLPVEGAYVLGALSGYGLMAANGAADLVADHVAGRRLPPYAPAFSLSRYEDPAYLALLDRWGDTGQL
jgi:glycine/D-amino acid oxidase-like deaminating enzyme